MVHTEYNTGILRPHVIMKYRKQTNDILQKKMNLVF